MNALTITNNSLTITDLSQAMADILHLNVADGDALPKRIASYLTEVRQYTLRYESEGINPARATEDDLRAYRDYLVANYTRGTVTTKLAAIRRFYDAALWRGLRLDNPARYLSALMDE
jgi:site-specific recombinase XerD